MLLSVVCRVVVSDFVVRSVMFLLVVVSVVRSVVESMVVVSLSVIVMSWSVEGLVSNVMFVSFSGLLVLLRVMFELLVLLLVFFVFLW